jgi:hypothetical protein
MTTKQRVPYRQQPELVRLVRELSVTKSLQDVADELASTGYLSSKGTPINRSVVYKKRER